MAPIGYPDVTTATDAARYLSGLYSADNVAWHASIAPAPMPLMNRRMMNSVSEFAFAVRMIDAPTRHTLRIISLRRPMMSDTGARNIAPAIMPASAKLKIHPNRSGVSCSSDDTAPATTAIAVMSKPSSKLKNRHNPTTRICGALTSPLSITSATILALLAGLAASGIRTLQVSC